MILSWQYGHPSYLLTRAVPYWCSWVQTWYLKSLPVQRKIEGEMALAKRVQLLDSANTPGNPRMNNFRNNMSTYTQTWAECDVMSAHDLISMLLEKTGDFFQLMGIWYLSLVSICWKSYCEAYLFRHAFSKNYFCLGGFGVGFYLTKNGRGSKSQTDFFFNVLTDSLYLLENVKKCI